MNPLENNQNKSDEAENMILQPSELTGNVQSDSILINDKLNDRRSNRNKTVGSDK